MQLDVILVVFLQLCESTIEGFKPLDWGERLSQGHLFMYHHGCTSNEVQFHDMCRSCARLQGKAFRERTDRILQARAKLTLSLPQLFLLCRRALVSSHGSLEMSDQGAASHYRQSTMLTAGLFARAGNPSRAVSVQPAAEAVTEFVHGSEVQQPLTSVN